MYIDFIYLYKNYLIILLKKKWFQEGLKRKSEIRLVDSVTKFFKI